MLTPETGEKHWQRNEPPLAPGQTTEFDWSARLSLDIIRQHTKTDDIPGVTDDQLKLYRASAIEAAERFTGLLLSGQRTVTEPIEHESMFQRQEDAWLLATYRKSPMYYRHTLKYPVADGMVYLYGGHHPNDNVSFLVPPGTRSIKVPIRMGFLDLSNCCDPCAKHHYNHGMMVAYKAGYKCSDDVPSGIVLGCLQFMAWLIEHPGDELLTQRNRIEARSVGVDGSNNVAWVSGALETWRIYDPEAF